MNLTESVEALRKAGDRAFASALAAFIDRHYNGDHRAFADQVGYSESRVRGYLSGAKPSKRFKIWLTALPEKACEWPYENGRMVDRPLLLDHAALLDRSKGCERIYVFRTSQMVATRDKKFRARLFRFLADSPNTSLVLMPREHSDAVGSIMVFADWINKADETVKTAARQIEVCEIQDTEGIDQWRRIVTEVAASTHVVLVQHSESSGISPTCYLGIRIANSIPSSPGRIEPTGDEYFAPMTTDVAEAFRSRTEHHYVESMAEPILDWLERKRAKKEPHTHGVHATASV
jgi:hypothetical protein